MKNNRILNLNLILCWIAMLIEKMNVKASFCVDLQNNSDDSCEDNSCCCKDELKKRYLSPHEDSENIPTEEKQKNTETEQVVFDINLRNESESSSSYCISLKTKTFEEIEQQKTDISKYLQKEDSLSDDKAILNYESRLKSHDFYELFNIFNFNEFVKLLKQYFEEFYPHTPLVVKKEEDIIGSKGYHIRDPFFCHKLINHNEETTAIFDENSQNFVNMFNDAEWKDSENVIFFILEFHFLNQKSTTFIFHGKSEQEIISCLYSEDNLIFELLYSLHFRIYAENENNIKQYMRCFKNMMMELSHNKKIRIVELNYKNNCKCTITFIPFSIICRNERSDDLKGLMEFLKNLII